MYIEIRKAGKNRKYYLAHSFRKGDRVKKIKVYLGLNLSGAELAAKRGGAEAKIKARISAAEAIHDPLKTVLSSSELEELRTLGAKVAIEIHHLSEEEWTSFIESFTYDTNAIEGSMVTAREVKSILERDKWPADKTREDISETYGVAEAIKHIRKIKVPLSLELMKELHLLIFRNSKTFAGKFRKKGEEVVVADAAGNIVHRGAPSTQVLNLLKELTKWYEKNSRRYSPLVLAAVVHNQFENIHPFRDGNGRIGRLLMINILLKHGKPPLNIELRNRQDYYAALQAYQKEGNLRPTIELMLKEYKELRKMLKRKGIRRSPIRKSWHYWMYEYAKKTGFGSFMPDFDQGPLTQKEFNESIRGQTVHKLSEKELAELKKLAQK
jgi:Fic family protein